MRFQKNERGDMSFLFHKWTFQTQTNCMQSIKIVQYGKGYPQLPLTV